MQRNLGETGTFTFEGNYFTIDASKVPYVEKERGDNTLNKLSTSVVSHMPLFAIVGEADTNDTTATENFDVKNVNFIGNLNRQEDVKNSGGLILIKYLYAKQQLADIPRLFLLLILSRIRVWYLMML